jgi:hypothetical protein
MPRGPRGTSTEHRASRPGDRPLGARASRPPAGQPGGCGTPGRRRVALSSQSAASAMPGAAACRRSATDPRRVHVRLSAGETPALQGATAALPWAANSRTRVAAAPASRPAGGPVVTGRPQGPGSGETASPTRPASAYRGHAGRASGRDARAPRGRPPRRGACFGVVVARGPRGIVNAIVFTIW